MSKHHIRAAMRSGHSPSRAVAIADEMHRQEKSNDSDEDTEEAEKNADGDFPDTDDVFGEENDETDPEEMEQSSMAEGGVSDAQAAMNNVKNIPTPFPEPSNMPSPQSAASNTPPKKMKHGGMMRKFPGIGKK